MSYAAEPPPGGPPSGRRGEPPQNIATAIAEVSERATDLVHEEIELAKAEIAEKIGQYLRSAIIAAVAGVFVLMAVILALVGGAWLLYYYLPGPTFAYFWGFFAMAALLLVVGRHRGADRGQNRQTCRPAGAGDGDRRGQENSRHRERDAGREGRRGRRGRALGTRGRAGQLMPARSAEEIRNSMEANRAELAVSVGAPAGRGDAPDRLAHPRRGPPPGDRHRRGRRRLRHRRAHAARPSPPPRRR